MTTIAETCSCGATFAATADYMSTLSTAADRWRETHKHAESVGICGDRPPPMTLGGVEIDRAPCELKAGHAGLHADGRGDHWTANPPKSAETGPGTASEPESGSQPARDSDSATEGETA